MIRRTPRSTRTDTLFPSTTLFRSRLSVADPALRQQIFDLRDDPAAASNMAAALTGDNRTYLESRIGRGAEPVDLYLAHFLGSGGAAKFLAALDANPHQPGASMMPEASAETRRSEESRVGTACVRTWRSRRARGHSKKHKK